MESYWTFNGATNVGDFVAVSRDRGSTRKAKIARVLAAQIEIEGVKYMRRNGYKVGGDKWNIESARPWTAEVESRIADDAAEAIRATRQSVALEKLRSALISLDTKRNCGARRLTIAQLDGVDDLTSIVAAHVATVLGWEPE